MLHAASRRMFALLAAATLSALVTGCGGGGTTLTGEQQGQTGVKVTATVANLGGSRAIRIGGFRQGSVNVTPSVYELALVNFWLIKEDSTEVNIINPDEDNPTYTEDNPLILRFTSGDQIKELLSTVPSGTYVGYKMQFLYMEMRLPVIFHLPSCDGESDYPSAADILDVERECNFRLYFNAVGKYWKRDFVVELDDGSGLWYWLRREIESNPDVDNFFISVDSNEHPSGGAGPTSTIDLFANAEFWGDPDDYSNPSSPIIVGTHSTAGGVEARLEHSFTIPEVIDEFYNIDVQIDISNTMNFYEDWSPPPGIVFADGVLDLGPGFGGLSYGDGGLHPFMPRLNVTVTAGSSDTKPDATPAEQEN